ncbi:hypothetical protein [Flavobacterium wongokense]|uniref:hypothetical protein n=1 Tax=Flavobacterium wongokense TaxID=2910674 RepID=UPI001F1840E0|nr:hypothetical protein [Flavobacterium sp. WG47]MCF6131730.1 hypothetical protein [Flavobacterium sp. WG47]
MKLPKELINGIIIFAGIALYFLVIDFLNLSDILWLRVFNVLFVWYGVTRTLSSNMAEGKRDYAYNLFSAGATALLGVIFAIIGLVSYIHLRGGDTYIKNFSEDLLFGGEPTANQYCIGILFEGVASALIVVFVSVQYWRRKMAPQD